MNLGNPCEVMTFYSYTGGAGRSMALANVACLLARRCESERGVLMVDWDLQSPGLHYYFNRSLGAWREAGGDLDQQPGLLELFTQLESLISSRNPEPDDGPALFEELDPDRYAISTDVPRLSLLKAGRFDGYYFSAVSSFPWAGLLERVPWLMEALIAHWARRYRYVLIDSTIGVNDISGLCAMAFPDKLLSFFVPSQQSLSGLIEVARCASDFRKSAGNGRSLAIYPVPCKMEMSEPGLRRQWRFGAESAGTDGYQARFENLFRELTPESHGPLAAYFDDIQIPYVPRFAYCGDVAATIRALSDSNLVRAYERLTERVMGTSDPWDPFDPGDDLSVVEIDGRRMPLLDGEKFCLTEIIRYSAQQDHLHAAETMETLAGIKERLGMPAEAEAHYLEAIALCRARGHQAGIASAVSGLARLERLMGRLVDSRVYYLDASRIYRNLQQGAALASTLATLGNLDAQLDENVAAAEHYREAIERYQAEGDDAGVARTLMCLGDLDKRLGRNEKAEEHYRDAAQTWRRERDLQNLARALTSLGDVQGRLGKGELAEDSYSRAAELYRAEDDSLRLANALRSLGDVRRGLKKTEQAITHYQEAIDLFRREGENLGLASALFCLADLESRSGGNSQAKEHFEEAFVLYRKEEQIIGTANALRGLGEVERRMGRPDLARSRYEEAMELYRVAGNAIGQANTLQSLGDLEKRLGNGKDAQARYTEAIQIFRNEDSTVGVANSLKSLGDLEREAGNPKIAKDHYDQAIELYSAGGRPLGLANTLQSLGDLERSRRRFKEATEHYASARDLYKQEKHLSGLAYTCSEMARVSHALFDITGSIEYLNEANAAAADSKLPSVMAYVAGVQREIQGVGAR